MYVGRGRVVVNVLAVLSTLGSTDRVVAQAPSCASRLEVVGDARLAGALIEGLSAEIPANECEGVIVEVEPGAEGHGGYRVAFTRGDRRVARAVSNVATGAIWLESWLAPASPRAPVAPTVATAEVAAARAPMQARDDEAPPNQPPTAAALPQTVTVREEVGPEGLVAASLGAVVDDGGIGWLVPQVVATLHTSSAAWLAAALSASWDLAEVSQNSNRTVARASLRGGGRVHLPIGSLRAGAGVGLAASTTEHESSTGVREETENGPFFEVVADLTIPLAGPVALVVGGTGTWQLPEEPEDDPAAPPPLPTLFGGAHAGVAWTFGGSE